jgi:hypothetical protein
VVIFSSGEQKETEASFAETVTSFFMPLKTIANKSNFHCLLKAFLPWHRHC